MTDGYRVLPTYERFNQKNHTIMRSSWDPSLGFFADRAAKTVADRIAREEAGHTRLDYAFNGGAGTVKESLGTAVNGPDGGLTSWEPLFDAYPHEFPVPPGDLGTDDAAEARGWIENAARYFGADLVGFTELDERWLYSNHYLPETGENPPVRLPEGCDQVVVMGMELERDLMQTAPTAMMTAETSMNYSRMAVLVASVAEFIRTLGYAAIPALNDTALSVPLAIDAGLAQYSRGGFSITAKYGPRIRFCKVFTDMPLDAEKNHVDLGVVEFCEVCKKCAEACPSQTLPLGEQTTEGHSMSNTPGVLKWYADYEKCRKYWPSIGSNCGICIRVCPFNEGKGFHHDVVRWFVRRKIRLLNRFFVWLHDVLGYGKQKDPRRFWRRRPRFGR
jgi:reductive dehalogenase